MHRPPRNCVVCSASVSLPRGWELNLVIIIKAEVSIEKKEVIVIIIKKFIVGIRALELNLFRLIARVSCRRVYSQHAEMHERS